MRLEGKVALVTGASKGIGRGIAQRFAGEGADVVLVGRSESRGREVEAEIRADGGSAVFVPTDIGKEPDVVRAVRTAVDVFGRLTTLVNNAAATQHFTKLAAMSNETLAESIQTNVFGLAWCCKYAVPEMISAGGGSIINISSVGAVRGAPRMDAYTATKGSMNALTRSLAVEFGRQRIRVNTINTGFIESGEHTSEFMARSGQREYLENRIPLPYFGLPDDIAWGCVYLASDEARYVTGAELAIDGGYLA